MVCQYKKICKEHNCKAKVFTQMPAKLGNQIGSPDLIILFTNTVSHKMVRCAVAEADGRFPKDPGWSGWTGRDFFDEKNNTIKHLQYTPRGYIMSLQMRNRNRLAGK